MGLKRRRWLYAQGIASLNLFQIPLRTAARKINKRESLPMYWFKMFISHKAGSKTGIAILQKPKVACVLDSML
jgi:hypothetical protein